MYIKQVLTMVPIVNFESVGVDWNKKITNINRKSVVLILYYDENEKTKETEILQLN